MLAAGAIDASFGNNGVAVALFGANDATAYASALEADGKLVVAGGLQSAQHQSLGFIVARFNADGSLDTTFGAGGTTIISPGGTVHNLAIQPDGKILIAGDDAGNLQQNVLVRLTDAGDLDTTFGSDGRAVLNGISSDFALMPDGKIVSVQGDNGTYQLTRFDPDGTLDTSFGQDGVATTTAATVVPPTDIVLDGSKIVVSGDVNQSNPAVDGVTVTRFNADGSLDTAFGSDGTARTQLPGSVNTFNCVAIQPDGKILAGGLSVHPQTQIGWDLILFRYNADGTLDSTFGNGGIVLDSIPSHDTAINRMFVEPNGKIVAAGRLGENAALFRFDAVGSLDSSFGSGGVAAATNFQHDGYGAVEQADGKYLLAGTAGSPTQFAVERFIGETPPSTSGIADVTAAENGPNPVISLANDFTGGSVPANQLVYSLVGDTNSGLFASATFDAEAGTLTLALTPDQLGSALLTVRAFDPDGAYFDASFHVTVGPANVLPVVLSAIAPPAFNEGIAADNQVLATFTDPAGDLAASQYQATINWGDGTSPSVASVSGPDATGLFTVLAGHTYVEEAAGAPLIISVTRDGVNPATAQSTVQVTDAPLTGSALTLSAPGASSATSVVGRFTDGNLSASSEDFTATIDWGDGETSRGAVSGENGSFSVAGNHSYAANGTFAVQATIADDGAATVLSGSAVIASAGTPHQRYVDAVFNDVLGRAADPDGLAYWTQQLDSGAPISRIAEAIAHSDEYYAKFVIQPDYLKLLGRAADGTGIAYWTGRMHSGLTDQQLEADLASSNEFYKTAGGTNAAWIDAVYKQLLGRAADAGGESYWGNRLAGGESLNAAAQGIAGSAENNTQLINSDYFHYLGRAADGEGLKFWLAQFTAGKTNEDIIAGFTKATEYYTAHTG